MSWTHKLKPPRVAKAIGVHNLLVWSVTSYSVRHVRNVVIHFAPVMCYRLFGVSCEKWDYRSSCHLLRAVRCVVWEMKSSLHFAHVMWYKLFEFSCKKCADSHLHFAHVTRCGVCHMRKNPHLTLTRNTVCMMCWCEKCNNPYLAHVMCYPLLGVSCEK